MTKDEAMQIALDVLQALNKDGWILADFENQVYAATDALRTALAQPKKEWVGLTEADKKGIFNACEPDERSYVIAMVEALLKDKNHG